jgi:hypothetical protein
MERDNLGMTLLIAGVLAMLGGLLAWPLWRRVPLSRRRLAVMGEGAARPIMIIGGALVALMGVFLIAFSA